MPKFYLQKADSRYKYKSKIKYIKYEDKNINLTPKQIYLNK